MTEPRAVEIEGKIKRLRTMADGSIDLTINLPEYCQGQAGVMLKWINEIVGGVLEVRRSEKQEGNRNNGKARNMATGTKRKSEWTTAEETGTN